MSGDKYNYGVEFCGVQGMLGNPNSPKTLDNTDGESLFRYHIRNSFRKTISMFKYDNLPNTVPRRIVELNTQSAGYSVWFKHEDGNIYNTFARLGGVPDYNYMPTVAIVSNPYLKVFKEFTVNEDCVLMPNDSLFLGLGTINSYYAYQLKDNDLSRRILMVNLRAMLLLLATNNDDYENCKTLLKDLEQGKLSAIKSTSWRNLIENLPISSNSNTQTLIQIIEDKQYIKGSWLNELGVQSNYNMKRETITSNENILNVDGLLPLVDDMFFCRKEAIKRVNAMFGTQISVDMDSAWSKIRKEIAISEERQTEEVKSIGENSTLDGKNGKGE